MRRVGRVALGVWRGAALAAGLGVFALCLASDASTGRGGSSSAEFLRVGTGARGAAMGDAFTALASGNDAMHYNPAGLGWTPRAAVSGSYQAVVENIKYGDLSIVAPLPRTRGVAGAEVKFVDYGTMDRTILNTAGPFVSATRNGLFEAQDFAGGLGYGMRFGNWSLGVVGRGISSKIDDASATAFAADLGIQHRSSILPIEVGLAVKNLGTQLQYDVRKEDLPLLVRFGVATRLFRDRLRLAFEVEQARKEDMAFLGGAEVVIAKILSLRAGYDGRSEVAQGFTAGAGFAYKDLRLDYAYVPFGDFGDNHRVGLTYLFGPELASDPIPEQAAARPTRVERRAVMPPRHSTPAPPPAPSTASSATASASATPGASGEAEAARREAEAALRAAQSRTTTATTSASSSTAVTTSAPAVTIPPMRYHVAEFENRGSGGSLPGIETLKAEMVQYLSRSGNLASSLREADRTIMGEYWVKSDGTVTFAAVLYKGLTERARQQVTTSFTALDDAAEREKILTQILTAFRE